MILGAGIIQVPIIERCKKLGYTTYVLDYLGDAPGMVIADYAFITSTLDKEKALEIARDNKIDAVITTSDLPVNTVAYICENLGLKGISVEAANICTNKYLQRVICSKNGIRSPKYLKFDFSSKLNLQQLNFPLVFKPIGSSASRGVSLVKNEFEIEQALDLAKKYSANNELIIEEYIGGTEYSIEGLVQNNKLNIIGITEKSTSESNSTVYFVELQHITSISFDSEMQNKIENFANKVVQLFKIDNSSIHLEFKIFQDEIYLIECACRLGGDFITSDLIPLSTGIDMLQSIVNIAMGMPICLDSSVKRFAGIKFFTSNDYYQYKKYIELNADSLPIHKYHFEEFSDKPLLSSLDRLGYFIASHEDKEVLINILNKTNGNI